MTAFNKQRTANFSFGDLSTAPFSPESYSALKFGNSDVAHTFGTAMARHFFDRHAAQLLTRQSVVIASPYNFVMNAASLLTQHFVNELNRLLVNANGRAVETTVIHRKVSYISDYGFLPASQRRKLIDGDSFYFNTEFVKGKNLIFIDDVLITGTHEMKLREVLKANGLSNPAFFVYYAMYTNGDKGAEVEAALNFSYIKSVEELVKMVNDYHGSAYPCRPLVRPLKYMLSSNADEFADALKRLPSTYIREMYYGALGEGYNAIPAYHANFQQLSEFVERVLN